MSDGINHLENIDENELRRHAGERGFSAIGIIGRSRFAALPHGPVADAAVLSSPESVAPDVRSAERRFIKRPTEKSFIECTICLAACPIGKI